MRSHGRRVPVERRDRRRAAHSDLEGRFDVLFHWALASALPQPLQIPGEDLAGSGGCAAISLRITRPAQTIRVGRHVVVIGGGNTAIDAANAALAPGRRARSTCSIAAASGDAGLSIRI